MGEAHKGGGEKWSGTPCQSDLSPKEKRSERTQEMGPSEKVKDTQRRGMIVRWDCFWFCSERRWQGSYQRGPCLACADGLVVLKA